MALARALAARGCSPARRPLAGRPRRRVGGGRDDRLRLPGDGRLVRPLWPDRMAATAAESRRDADGRGRLSPVSQSAAELVGRLGGADAGTALRRLLGDRVRRPAARLPTRSPARAGRLADRRGGRGAAGSPAARLPPLPRGGRRLLAPGGVQEPPA